MSVGRRMARHETIGVQKNAVVSEDWADFKVGQHVMTIDGFPGHVASIEDGPFPGTEAYRVTLDNDLGGGLYSTGQLSSMPSTTASGEHSAANDYPELSEILVQRPDIAKEH